MKTFFITTAIAALTITAAHADELGLAYNKLQVDQGKLTELLNGQHIQCYPHGPKISFCDSVQIDIAAVRNQINADNAEVARLRSKLDKQLQEQTRIATLPINRLATAYTLYKYISICNQVREGYLVQYVSNDELDRAKLAVKYIANKATTDDPSLNTDAIWAKADPATVFPQVSESYCRMTIAQLINSSPISVWHVAKP